MAGTDGPQEILPIESLAGDMASITLQSPTPDWLPTEIYEVIFEALKEKNLRTLLACRLTCSRVKAIAELPSMWKSRFKRRWKYHDSAREAAREASLGNDWWRRYMRRIEADREISSLLTQISITRKGRYARSATIARDYGKDSWDVLGKYATASPPPVDTSGVEDRWLSRTFWAKEVLGAMHRASAVDRLFRLSEGEKLELEEGLSVLSSFYCVPYEVIKEKLDALAEACKATLTEGLDTTAKCLEICQWMRTQGFGPVGAMDYDNLNNRFLHKVLEPDNHKSIPLSLVAIFVAIARRLGMDAHAVPFPSHVHAWIRLEDTSESISVDVYNSNARAILTAADLELVLNAVGSSSAQHPEFIEPASTATMVTRAAMNVANSLRPGAPPGRGEGVTRFWNVITACYAMVATITCIRHPNQGDDQFVELATHIKQRIRHVFTCDVPIVVQQTMIPRLRPSQRNAKYILQDVVRLTQEQEEEPISPPKHRTRGGIALRLHYCIGLVVALYGSGDAYIGVITGWNDDGTYVTEENIRSTPADPVYEITYTTTGSSKFHDTHTRYELQTRVLPFAAPGTGKVWAVYHVVLPIVQDIGRLFRSAICTTSRHLWFVPGDELAAEYPDDIAAGQHFVATMGENPNPEFMMPSL